MSVVTQHLVSNTLTATDVGQALQMLDRNFVISNSNNLVSPSPDTGDLVHADPPLTTDLTPPVVTTHSRQT